MATGETGKPDQVHEPDDSRRCGVPPERSEYMERLFLGVPLTGPAREALRARLPESIPGTPVPADNWHVTLRFLGDTPAGQRDEIVAALRTEPLPRSFTVEFTGMGAFPDARHAKVLWVGARQGAQALEALASVAERIAVGAGFDPDLRRFHPHVTVARMRRPLDSRGVVERRWPAPILMAVTNLVLFRSRLGSGPAHYDIQEAFSLRD